MAPIALAAIVYNSNASIVGFILTAYFPDPRFAVYYLGNFVVCVCLSFAISVILDARLRAFGCVPWRFILVLSFVFGVISLPAIWFLWFSPPISGVKNGLLSALIDGIVSLATGYAAWAVVHLCIRSAERGIAQERRTAALREAMLRYENEALSCALDSGFFVDALKRIARALKEEAGVLAGEIVISLSERMRAALAPSESTLAEAADETFAESKVRVESGEIPEASLRRLLLIGALGVWAALFIASCLSEIVDGRLWWKPLSDYGIHSSVGALWFVFAGRVLRKATTYRVRILSLIVFGICVAGICACGVSLYLSFALRGDLAWPPLIGWIVGFELNNVTPIFIGWAAVYLLIEARRREITRLRAAAEIREAALNARNAMLRLQVNPHFLFNALNALYALILDRQFERARVMIAAIKRFLDRADDPRQSELVPLSRELATQDAYLAIERVRFGDRLQVERSINGEVAAAKVPHLILQPLVENAVKYAVARTDRPVAVEIRARRAGRELVLEVTDTGAPEAAPRSPGLGMGLRNVEARLKSLYGEAGRLACRPLEPAGFLAEVRLPLSL